MLRLRSGMSSGPTSRSSRVVAALAVAALSAASLGVTGGGAQAQEPGPAMLHPGLTVQTAVSGLVTPISLAFLGEDDMLVTEKVTGRVKRVTAGVVGATVLDLAVNSASERGLLGMALHPDFPADSGVYLYWTESATGADTSVLAETPLLGNRVDRFVWNGSTLAFDRNLLHLRALQQDAGQPLRGNHDGGVLRFAQDGKLLVFVGDLGRRGQMQNLACGPTAVCPGPVVPDDQFGGPQPDNAHLSGVVLRLNDDGTAPADNPFYATGAATGGEVGANLQRLFSYGHRNAIGMAVDPRSGGVWLAENGDDSFSELNRVDAGMNGGWIQVMGPIDRVGEFRQIETTPPFVGLQQLRWSPDNIALTPAEARSRLFMLPGAHYSDPELSWKYEVAPGGIGFVAGRALGPQFDGSLFMGAARPALEGGHLFQIKLTGSRNKVGVDDRRLEDRVADNNAKYDLTESESLLVGRDFGVVSDIQTGADGNLYAVSVTNGAVYKISRRAR
jgi:aldose sugar dehydrogenase